MAKEKKYDLEDNRKALQSLIIDNNSEKFIKLINSNKELLSEKFSAGNKLDNVEMPLLIYSIYKNVDEIAHYLIDNYPETLNAASSRNSLPLYWASWMGNTEVVARILNKGVDINATNDNGATALYAAVSKQHSKVIEKLIEFKADVNIGDKMELNPLCLALLNNDIETVKTLLSEVTEVNYVIEGYTPLIIAACKDQPEAIRLLVEAGAKVDFSGEEGNTPLHIASILGNLNALEALISYKPNIEVLDGEGHTPLMRAVQKDQPKVIRLLIEGGAEIEAYSDKKFNALHHSIISGNFEVFVELISLKANIEAKTFNGLTPLYFACVYNRGSMVKLLLDYNANIETQDKAGGTPLLKAVDLGYYDIVLELLNRGAKLAGKGFSNDNITNIAEKRNVPEIIQIIKYGNLIDKLFSSNNNLSIDAFYELNITKDVDLINAFAGRIDLLLSALQDKPDKKEILSSLLKFIKVMKFADCNPIFCDKILEKFDIYEDIPTLKSLSALQFLKTESNNIKALFSDQEKVPLEIQEYCMKLSGLYGEISDIEYN